ncbi:hypothetical protein PYV61_17410, partial [Roseisolibacter sp. H3M3-2]
MKLSRRALAAAVRAPAADGPTSLQAENWRLLREELAADAEGVAEYARWTARRRAALPELRALVERFVAGDAGLEELRSTLDRRTRREWDALGLRGASGAMFLNQLARRAPEPRPLERALRAALSLPASDAEARARLDALVGALGARDGARAVFLASVCWHAQAPADWPGYHPSARQALTLEDALFVATGHAAADYVAFRQVFLALARAIDASPEELEFLCWWHLRRAPAWDPPEPDDEPPADRPAVALRAPRGRRVSPTPARAVEYPR